MSFIKVFNIPLYING